MIGMEANPTIYNTNYINDTRSAIELIQKVDSAGFKLNLDVGTMIYNQESVDDIVGSVRLINHVHISEPGLSRSKVENFIVNLKIFCYLKNIKASYLLRWERWKYRHT